MTTKEINQKMVLDLEELLLKHDLFHGTKIYFNNKCISDLGDEIVVHDNVQVEAYQDWCNPSMISMYYEGLNSLYFVVNGNAGTDEERKRANTITSQLIRISAKYNRYFELGTDNTLYFVSDDDINLSPKKYYYGKETI